MVRLGQFVQGQHAEDGSERGSENRQLKCDGNESRPAIERAAADVQGISDGRSPVLEEKTANTARQAAKKTNQRHHIALQAKRFGETFDGEWRISVYAMVAGGTDFLDR